MIPTHFSIAVLVQDPTLQKPSEILANTLNIPLTFIKDCTYDFLFLYQSNFLCLLIPAFPTLQPLWIDFLYTSRTGQELLQRAIHIEKMPKQKFSILDLTAGLGTDTKSMLHYGHTVHMLEKSPLLGALLQDALNRAIALYPTIPLSLDITDSYSYLHNISYIPDIIYLDPMFPKQSSKTALPNKGLQILRYLMLDDPHSDNLLNLALSKAKYKVIVKRPRLASTLGNKTPTYKIEGKSSRFDVYYLS